MLSRLLEVDWQMVGALFAFGVAVYVGEKLQRHLER